AIILECVYIVLAVLALKTVMGKGKKKNKKGMAMMVTIPSITIASIVIVANTLSTTHLRIMVSLTPLYNALILIVGGYVLQILLIISSLYEYREMMRLADLNAK
ncbi:MAG: hypothetical protein QW776_05295, partial [Candidatus Nitrosocaldus sp.]